MMSIAVGNARLMMSIAVGNAASFYEQRIDHLVKPSRARPKGNPHLKCAEIYWIFQ